MQVADVSPNRLGRARHEISDLIRKNREVRLGLMVFASVPHVIAPITEDTQTLMNALPALSVELASPNLQGSRLGPALDRAEVLLAGLPADSARAILLISDGDFDEPDLLARVEGLAASRIRVHVLGIGSAQGGLVQAPGGGTLRDPRGDPIRSRLDETQLARIAEVGGGLYRLADYRDADTDAILRAAAVSRLPPRPKRSLPCPPDWLPRHRKRKALMRMNAFRFAIVCLSICTVFSICAGACASEAILQTVKRPFSASRVSN